MQSRDRFDRFTERAKRVLHLARQEAQQLHHNSIGVEHLWLGLMSEGEGVGAKALRDQGVNLQNMRNAVDALKRDDEKGKASPGELGLSESGKQVIEQAVVEAQRLNHHYIGTEHLLLALVRQADKTTQNIFDTLGVKLADLIDQTIRILSQSGARHQNVTAQTQGGRQDKFLRFSTQCRKALAFAQEEAQRFQHNYIGTEHLLLGLLRQTDGLAYAVLSSLGVELNNARSQLELIVGRGNRIVLGEIHMTPRAQHLIDLAVQEADLLESQPIETEHLLLGLIREGEGVANLMLQSLGVSGAKVYVQTLHHLGKYISLRATLLRTAPASGSGTGQGQEQRQAGAASQDTPTPSAEDEATATGLIQRFKDQTYGAGRFNEQMKSALAFAVQEARRFQHNYIGTEHLLLGLTQVEGSIASETLAQMGVELAKVRSAVEFIIGRGDRIVLGQLGLTPRAKKVIELAVDEANLMQHEAIGAEHLLLGLVREGEGIAAGVLESLGVKLPAVRKQVVQLIERNQQNP